MGERNITIRYIRPIMMSAGVLFKQQSTDLFVIFTIVVQPMIVALLALWMLGDAVDDAIYIVVGSGMTGLWSGLLFVGGNSITRERWTGTLETIVGLPTAMQVIVIGKNLANVAQSMISMVVCYTVASLFFGYPLVVEQPWLFAVSLVFTGIAFVSFALILAPLFLLNPAVQSFQNGMEFPVFLLSGFLFPILLLPNWTNPISYALPTYWAARALHDTSQGLATRQEILFVWAMLIGFSALYLVLSSWIFRAVLRKARVDATLNMQ